MFWAHISWGFSIYFGPDSFIKPVGFWLKRLLLGLACVYEMPTRPSCVSCNAQVYKVLSFRVLVAVNGERETKRKGWGGLVCNACNLSGNFFLVESLHSVDVGGFAERLKSVCSPCSCVCVCDCFVSQQNLNTSLFLSQTPHLFLLLSPTLSLSLSPQTHALMHISMYVFVTQKCRNVVF